MRAMDESNAGFEIPGLSTCLSGLKARRSSHVPFVSITRHFPTPVASLGPDPEFADRSFTPDPTCEAAVPVKWYFRKGHDSLVVRKLSLLRPLIESN